MNIKEYYISVFRNDLGAFMLDASLPYFGHSWDHDCKNLDKVTSQHRSMFLICLYFTILVDQAVHSYYPERYRQFEELTRYPKFCHSLGQFQKNPRDILSVPVRMGFIKASEVETYLPDGMALFVDEVTRFFSEYMPAIESGEFFSKLIYDPDVQIPELLVMANESLKNDIVYKAYKALRAAVA